MEGLIACLSDSSVDRETKPVVFSCIGDIAMALGSDFEPYFNTALSIAMDAIHKIQAIKAFVNSGDRSLIDFINRLQISLLEMYTGMIMGYGDDNVLTKIVPCVVCGLGFLEYLSKPTSCKEDMCLQKAVALVGDIALKMGSYASIKSYLSEQFVTSLVKKASESPNGAAQKIAESTQEVLDQLRICKVQGRE